MANDEEQCRMTNAEKKLPKGFVIRHSAFVIDRPACSARQADVKQSHAKTD
jgi:hypothetical protein